jgi:plasmid stabilization system protein ParE
MGDYRLSAAAEDDIQILFQSSQLMFGPRQTDIYMAGLGQALQDLAENPGIIQRVLHARMDFGSRL